MSTTSLPKSVNAKFSNRINRRKFINQLQPQKRRFFKLFKWVFFGAFFSGLTFALYSLFVNSDYLKVATLEITGTKGFVSQEDLREVAYSRLYGKNMLTVNLKSMQTVLLDTFQGAKNIKLTRKFPSTIQIVVDERVPLALVYNDTSPDTYIIDEDGYVLGLVDETTTNLPKIKYEGDTKVATFINKTLVPIYLQLTDSLKDENIKASSMSFYPKYAVVYLNNGIQSFISSDKDIKESVKILSVMLKQLAVEGENAKRIDLRYDKVIVSYE